MNAVIESYITRQRAAELEEHACPPSYPPYPEFDVHKVQLITSCIPNGENIDVVLHHSSQYSKWDFFHYHAFYELIYIYRGCAIQRFPQNELTLHEHDLLLLNPNAIHAPLTAAPNDCMFNIIVSRELLESWLLPSMEKSQLITDFVFDCLFSLSRARDYLYFPADPSGKATDIAECLIEEFISKNMNYERAMEAWLILLLTQLSRNYTEEGGQELLTNRETNRLMLEVLNYMEQNAPTLTLEGLAKHFGYSEGHLSRLIRQYTGKTYIQLIQHNKLEFARQYLQNSDVPVSDIMQRAGFHSAQHFYQLFKQNYLMSPSEYRKNYRSTADAVELKSAVSSE